MKIVLFADVHNNVWFKKIVEKFKDKEYILISLGDIAAVETKEFLKKEQTYRKIWKHKRTGEGKIDEKDEEWFDSLNINGWNNQMEILEEFRKELTLCLGNSDHAMLEWYKLKISKYLEIINKITLINIGKVNLLFLPYNSGDIKQNVLEKLKGIEKLYVISHCPPMKGTNKVYYDEIYNNVSKLSKTVNNITHLHGHMHPDDTYKYNLDAAVIYTLKATDTEDGFGSHNHIAVIDSNSGKLQFMNLNSEEILPKQLPEKYYMKDEHWNAFINQNPD